MGCNWKVDVPRQRSLLMWLFARSTRSQRGKDNAAFPSNVVINAHNNWLRYFYFSIFEIGILFFLQYKTEKEGIRVNVRCITLALLGPRTAPSAHAHAPLTPLSFKLRKCEHKFKGANKFCFFFYQHTFRLSIFHRRRVRSPHFSLRRYDFYRVLCSSLSHG